jgi:voltage-gated potassium channel
VIFSAILFILIVESVVIFVVGTLPDLPNGLAVTFPVLDGINIVIFTIEYLLRVYCSIERKSLRIHGPILGRLLYCIRILPLLDLISLLVYLFSFVWNLAGWQTIPQVYSIFRLGRLLLLIRAEKHLQAVKTLMRIFTDKRDILLAGMFVSLVVWITSSCLLYYTEKDASPVDFPDILASMMIMLRIVTAYGIPVDNLTTPGMVIVGINCFVAIYVFGIPAMIILYGYEEASEKVRKEYLRTSAGSESDSDDDPPQKDENEFPFKLVSSMCPLSQEGGNVGKSGKASTKKASQAEKAGDTSRRHQEEGNRIEKLIRDSKRHLQETIDF